MKQNKIPRNEYIRKPVGKTNPYKEDTIYTDMGQWKYPGQVTKIPSGDITMQGVPYPVYGQDNLGYSQMMYPGMDYQFPGQYVTEYPMAAYGGDPSLANIEGHYPFGGMYSKTHTHFKKGGWLDRYPEGGEPTGSTPAAANTSSEDEFFDKYTQAYEDLENEKKRVASVREKVAMIAANKAKSKNKKTRTDLSYLKIGAYYCNTHTGECFQDAGATTPEGKKVPVIPGNIQWDTHLPEYGFEWVDKPEPGDVAREQLYRSSDYQGKSLVPGFYTSHSGIVTQVADPNDPSKIFIGNAPGGSRFAYENQPLSQMLGSHIDDAKMKYQRYVGNVPVYKETFEGLKKQLTPTTLPSKDITSLSEYTDTEEPDLLRYGGLRKNRQTRGKTSKNIQSSINKLFLRNYDIYGPSGKREYDPKAKYEEGGWLDAYQKGGSNEYSIVDYLISKGINPSKENRALLAKQSGIKGYDYTADKNLELLEALKQQSQKPKVQEVKKPIFTPYLPQKQVMPSETTQRGLLKNKPVVSKQDVAMAAKPAAERAAIRQAQLANKVPKKEDVLQQKQEQSTASKAWDVALNPLTAFGAYNKYGYLPDNFTEGDGNLIDQAALSVVNPAFYANAIGKTIGNVFSGDTYKDIPKAIASGVLNLAGDQVPEGYDEAAMRTAGRVGDALVGAQGLGFAKTIPRSIRDTKYDNVLTLGKGSSKQSFKNSAEWMDAYKAESAATGKQRPLMKKEVDFLNKEIKQRGILEASRRHPLDPRSALSKALIVPEDYNFGKILKDLPQTAWTSLTKGNPESLYKLGHGRVAGFNQYLGFPTKNNPYRIHPESFTEGRGLTYTIPENQLQKLQGAFEDQMLPSETIPALNDPFYQESLWNNSKDFHSRGYNRVKEGLKDYGMSDKEAKEILGPKKDFKYNIKDDPYAQNDAIDWIKQEPGGFRISDWDRYAGSHGGVSWNVRNLPKSKWKKWTMEDVWDINPFSRKQNLPKMIRDVDFAPVMGGKNFTVNLDYLMSPSGDVIPSIPKAKGGETEWLDKAQDGKEYSDAEANYLNRKAYEESLAQSRKDYVKDFVKQGTQDALLNTPFNFISSFTPAGVPIYLGQSALSAGQNLANKEYFGAGIDALFAAPLLKGTKKIVSPAIKKAGKLAFRGYKAGGWLDKYNNF